MYVYVVFKKNDEYELPMGVYDCPFEVMQKFKISKSTFYRCVDSKSCFYCNFEPYRILKVKLALADL